jgi:hypothetical protein
MRVLNHRQIRFMDLPVLKVQTVVKFTYLWLPIVEENRRPMHKLLFVSSIWRNELYVRWIYTDTNF